MKKIIFLDVDSTLYSHKTKEVPLSAINAIKKAKENGYLICLATGRSKLLTNQLHIFDVIDFDYFITINGSLILDKEDNIIYSSPVDKMSIESIISLTKKRGLNLCFISKDDYYLLEDEDERSHLGYDPLHITIPKKKDYLKEDIYQINLFCEKEYLEEFVALTNNKLNFTQLNNYGYDVNSKSSTKGSGIKNLLNYLKMDSNDAICVGDGINDLDMVENCKISIAMGNAISQLKNIASFTTTDIDDNGIYNAFKHFNII